MGRSELPQAQSAPKSNFPLLGECSDRPRRQGEKYDAGGQIHGYVHI